jgi:hypothetical protein
MTVMQYLGTGPDSPDRLAAPEKIESRLVLTNVADPTLLPLICPVVSVDDHVVEPLKPPRGAFRIQV